MRVVDIRSIADQAKLAGAKIVVDNTFLSRALDAGIRRHGATLSDYRQPDGRPGSMQKEFKVYGRLGEPCDRCGTPIEKTRVAGRGTWYCPTCQRNLV